MATACARPAHTGCFGLHEWAMVHRHRRDPPRLAAAARRRRAPTTVVESHRIACSHFDAYRFFTPTARPLNTLSPGRDDRAAYEQPGCLHATMDLYKHAFRLSPLVGSDLVADCFVLAWDVREVDMRASPYDFADLGFEPIRIETPEGKREYAARQRAFADRGRAAAAPARRGVRALAAGVAPRGLAVAAIVADHGLACPHDVGGALASSTVVLASLLLTSVPARVREAGPAVGVLHQGQDLLLLAVVRRAAPDHDPVRVHAGAVLLPRPALPDQRAASTTASTSRCRAAPSCSPPGTRPGRQQRRRSGSAYGANPMLLHTDRWDLVIGHTRKVFVRRATPSARAADRAGLRQRRARRLPPALREARPGRRPGHRDVPEGLLDLTLRADVSSHTAGP